MKPHIVRKYDQEDTRQDQQKDTRNQWESMRDYIAVIAMMVWLVYFLS